MSLFDTGIRPAIDNYLLELSKEKRSYGDYWSASSAGYCHRRLIFERLGVPHIESEEDARKQRVFTSGHLFHAWIQGITKAAGVSIAQEVELQDEDSMVRGHFDDLVLCTDESAPLDKNGWPTKPNKLILYDYKTRNSRNFDYAKRPSYFHKMQLGTYMYMLRKGHMHSAGGFSHTKELCSLIDNLTEARTLNIEKDTLRMAEVQYMWSDALEKEVKDYWTQLNAAWVRANEGVLPPCTCADHEGGFLAKEKFNPYFYKGEPCSLTYFKEWQESMAKITPDVMEAADEAFGDKK